ncbi:YihY/virulence factor BrkB family protein [Chloroflexi bacterium TSY]|nr:YihY/virulence factor BrkB family protein [Chloroflexi bacterium TSY]
MSNGQTQLPSIGNMLQMTFEKWYTDNIPRHAAVLAFYALFAVAPILLLTVEVMGLIYGREAAEAQVLTQVTYFVNSPETAELVRTILANILPSSATWWVTAAIIVALLYGASSFFGELKIVLNQIWGVPISSDSGIWELIFERLLAVLMVILGSLLFFFGLVLIAWLTTATDWAATYLNLGSGYATWSYLTMIFVLLTTVFALIYKFVPNVVIAWHDVLIGSAATALLISITRLLISLYFSYSRVSTMFGAAGALVIILLWVYYSAQIFFLGAEFTYIYSRTYGVWWRNGQLPDPTQFPAQETIALPSTLSNQNGDGMVRTENAEAHQSLSFSNDAVEPKSTEPIILEVENIEVEEHDEPTTTENRPITASVRKRIGAFRSRLAQVASLPIRITRPLREILVGVGVIGALSVAALVGIPWWRKRDDEVDSSPNEAE